MAACLRVPEHAVPVLEDRRQPPVPQHRANFRHAALVADLELAFGRRLLSAVAPDGRAASRAHLRDAEPRHPVPEFRTFPRREEERDIRENDPGRENQPRQSRLVDRERRREVPRLGPQAGKRKRDPRPPVSPPQMPRVAQEAYGVEHRIRKAEENPQSDGPHPRFHGAGGRFQPIQVILLRAPPVEPVVPARIVRLLVYRHAGTSRLRQESILAGRHGKGLHPDGVEPPRRQRHAVEKVVEARMGGALPGEQENLLEPHLLQHLQFSLRLRKLEAAPGLGPVGSESAVRAAVRAVVGQVEWSIQGDDAAEAALRQGAGALRHGFQEGVRRRREQRGEFPRTGLIAPKRPFDVLTRRPSSGESRRRIQPRGNLRSHGLSTERNAVRGLVARAVPPPGRMRPARCALRPATTACANAAAMAIGSPDAATALFTRTASHPISSAAAASEGERRPASTITGTRASRRMNRSIPAVARPPPLPIADPSGISDAHPASSSRLARTGSAGMYGITTNPSAARILAASNVSIGSGMRWCGSGWISTFTKGLPLSSRPMRAARTASGAFRAPEVFGIKVIPFSFRSGPSMSSSSGTRPTRRSATVTICAPEARTAPTMVSASRNLPVPIRSREVNRCPPTIHGSCSLPRRSMASPPDSRFMPPPIRRSPASDEAEQLHAIAFPQPARAPGGGGDHLIVQDDHHRPPADAHLLQQRRHGFGLLPLVRLPVDGQIHAQLLKIKKTRHGICRARISLASLRRHYPDQVQRV